MILNGLLPIVVFLGVGIISSELGLAGHFDFYSIFRIILIFLLIEISVFLQFRLSKGKISIRQYIVKATLPICVIGFLSCFLNHLFGYGRTLGTLGYSKDCGILTLLGIPDDICITLIFAFYLIVLPLIYILLQMHYLNKKILIKVSIMSCLLLSVICIVVFYTAHIFVDALLRLSFVYLYCLRLFLYLRSL